MTSSNSPALTPYQTALRDRMLDTPVLPAPPPWRRVVDAPVGGLLGIGFATHPDTGHDLVMAVSTGGHGLFDAVTGDRLARERDPEPEDSTPDESPDLTCPGLGPVTATRVHIAGLYGGGLHSTAEGWYLQVVSPDWPHHRVVLAAAGGRPHKDPYGETWWHVLHARHSEFRAAGFSPSGRTLAVATSSDLTMWTRQD